MTVDLGEASFRGEVGTEENCVHSTNNGISVRLEERCLFYYQREKEDMCRGR